MIRAHLVTGRIGRALASGGLAALLRLGALGVSFITVPLLLAALGEAGYGSWLGVHAAYLLLASLLDLGVGASLVTPLAQAQARGDRAEAGALLATALLIAGVAGGGVLAMGLPLAALLSALPAERALLGIPAAELPHLAAVLALALSLFLPLSVLGRALLAMGRTHLAAACEAGGQGLVLVALLLMPAGSGFTGAALAICIPPLLALSLQWLLVRDRLGGALASLSGALRRVPQALRDGLPFLLLQAAGLCAVTIDALLANWRLGPQEAAEIGVCQRLLTVVPLAASFVLAPLWPSFAASAGVRDWAHVRRAFLVVLALTTLAASAAVAAIVWWSPLLFDLWIGPGPRPDGAMLTGYAAWAWIACVGGVPALLLNGLGRLRFQVFCAIALIVCSLPVKLLLIGPLGAAGLVWGAVLVQVACVTIPASVYIALVARRSWHAC